jgi:hypothetical protein
MSWGSWQGSNLQPRRSKRRALPVELQERKSKDDVGGMKDEGGRMKDEMWISDFHPSSLILHPLSFDTDYLLNLGNDLHQIALVAHHCLDVFVSAGNFIQHAYVFAAFNT